MSNTSEVLIKIKDRIANIQEKLENPYLTGEMRILTEIWLDLNYLRWETLGDWADEKDNQ